MADGNSISLVDAIYETLLLHADFSPKLSEEQRNMVLEKLRERAVKKASDWNQFRLQMGLQPYS